MEYAGLARLVAVLMLSMGYPSPAVSEPSTPPPPQVVSVNAEVREYLESKGSPLAPSTDFLLEHEHWKLLIAISAIESQYCTRQIGWNCWGIGGGEHYRKYASIDEAITDADALIERWQLRGRWLTVEDMNCHYVQPCNPNWVYVVNSTLIKLNELEDVRPTTDVR